MPNRTADLRRHCALALVALVLVVALVGCSHATPVDSGTSNATASDGPVVVRGSVTTGARTGSPTGPYSPR